MVNIFHWISKLSGKLIAQIPEYNKIQPPIRWQNPWSREKFLNYIIDYANQIPDSIRYSIEHLNPTLYNIEQSFREETSIKLTAVNVYSIGVYLAESMVNEAQDYAKFFFECAIDLDNEYYPSYERLGHWHILQKREKSYRMAISCHKTAYYKTLGKPDHESIFATIPITNYRGANLLMIGICLKHLGENDLAKRFYNAAIEMVTENNRSYEYVGFPSKESVREFIFT